MRNTGGYVECGVREVMNDWLLDLEPFVCLNMNSLPGNYV